MAEEQTVSVVTCAFNPEPALLREAAASLAAQTRQPIEWIVVDDGSATPVEPPSGPWPFPVRVVRHGANLGQATALGTGVAEAKGSLVAFLDADDTWKPHKLEHQCAAWEREGSQLALLATRADVLDMEVGRLVRVRSTGGITRLDFGRVLRKEWYTGWSTLMMSRERFLSVGGCNLELRRCQDWDFWLRATSMTGLPVGLLEEALVIYRYEPRSWSAGPVALSVYRSWRAACERGEAPAVPERLLARLEQHHLLNFAYRAYAAGHADDGRAALASCRGEKLGSRWLRWIAAVGLRAPWLLVASIAYRKMLTGRIAWRAFPRDPRWTQ